MDKLVFNRAQTLNRDFGRNHRMRIKSKLTAAALGGVLLLTGCSMNNVSYAYEKDGERMPAGVYITGMIAAYGEAWQQAKTDDLRYPEKKDVLAVQMDGQTGEAWISARTRALALQYYGVEKGAADRGIALTEEERSALLSTTAGIWSGEMANQIYQSVMYFGIEPGAQQFLWLHSGEQFLENGIVQSSLESYLQNQELRGKLFLALYDTDGETPVPESEIKDRFVADYAKAGMMSFYKASTVDETVGESRTQEDIEADKLAAREKDAKVKEDAERFLERLKSGEAIEDLQHDYNVQNKAEDAADPEKPAEGSLNITVELNSTDPMFRDMAAMISSVPVGEAGLQEDEYGYYLIKRLDLKDDEASYQSNRFTVLQKLKNDDYEAQLEAWGAEAAPVVNTAALNKYTPKKLEL